MIYVLWFFLIWLLMELGWTGICWFLAQTDSDPTTGGAYAALWSMGVLFGIPIVSLITTIVLYFTRVI